MPRQRGAFSKRDVAKLAAMRRDGATWAQVDEAAAFHQSSTGWRETFEAHGFDKLGVKHGSNAKSKAKAWGTAGGRAQRTPDMAYGRSRPETR